jgi:hypothetical protein
VPLVAQEFPERLVDAVPEAGAIVEEHLNDQDGELLLHLLVADIRRFVLAAHERGDEELTGRVLAFLDLALTTGDSAVENAIAVSFVEDVGWWDPAVQAFIAIWPAGLRAEVKRQSATGA